MKTKSSSRSVYASNHRRCWSGESTSEVMNAVRTRSWLRQARVCGVSASVKGRSVTREPCRGAIRRLPIEGGDGASDAGHVALPHAQVQGQGDELVACPGRP